MKNYIYRLLKKSERLLKTDMIYIAKGTFWLTLGQVIFSITGLLLAVVYANLLPKDIYGTYKYILSLWGIISAFSLTGMSSAITRAVSQGFEGTLQKAFWINIKWSAITVGIAFIASLYYFLNGNNILGISFLIIGSFAPILGSAPLYESFLNGKKDFKAITYYGIFRNIFPAVTMILSVLLTQNLVLLTFVYFFSNSIAVFITYIITLKKHKPNTQIDKDAFTYGKHLSAMNMLSIGAEHIDKILIFHYLGAVELAIYAFASALPEQIRGLFKKLYTLALPRFSQWPKEELQKNIFSKISKVTSLGIFLTFLYIILAPNIFQWIFPQYLDSVFYSQLIALILIFSGNNLSTAFLESQRAIKEKYILNTINNLSRVILIILLVAPYGILGVIFARVFAQATSFFITLLFIKKF